MNIVGVTSCSTGIAQTYIAKERLEQNARRRGHNIKIETQGTMGMESPLTPEDIRKADLVVISVAVTIPNMERFAGKKIVHVPLETLIRSPNRFLDRVEAMEFDEKNGRGRLKRGWRSFFRHFQTGVTGMYPFLILGGILHSLVLLIPMFFPQTAGMEFLQLLKRSSELALALAVPVLTASLASSLGERSAYVPGLLIGILCWYSGAGPLGGIVLGTFIGCVQRYLYRFKGKPRLPSNQMAYIICPAISFVLALFLYYSLLKMPLCLAANWIRALFNGMEFSLRCALGVLIGALLAFNSGGGRNKIVSLLVNVLFADGIWTYMAAKVIASMVPSFTFLCALWAIKRNTLTVAEKKALLKNCSYGIFQIAEHPGPVLEPYRRAFLPASSISAAVAAGLTVYWGVECRLPQGGILALPFMSQPLYFLAALAVGTIAGSLVLAILLRVWGKEEIPGVQEHEIDDDLLMWEIGSEENK